MSILPLAVGALALAFIFLFPGAVPAVLRQAAAFAAALLALASPAFAGTPDLFDLAGPIVWPIVAPLLWALIGLGLLVAGNAIWKFINRGLDLLQAKTGIEVDVAHREALHRALDTGYHMAIKRGAPAIEEAIAAWVQKSVPDAVAHLGVTDELLDGLVDAKLAKAAVAAPLALPGAILPALADATAAAADLVAAPLQLAGAAA